MTQAQDDLRAAADLIEQKGWTQEACARDAFDTIVDVDDPGAQQFCVSGALRIATGHVGRDTKVPTSSTELRYLAAADAFTKHLNLESISRWNDTQWRSREDVIGALREVAAKL